MSEEGFETLHQGALPFANESSSRYAMGWSDDRWGGVRVLSHYGSWIGYHANMLIAPDTGDGLVLLTNAESYTGNRPRWEIAKNAFRRMLGQAEVQKPWFDASVGGVLALACACVAFGLWTLHGVWRLVRRSGPGGRTLVPAAAGFAASATICFGVPAAFDADIASIWWTTPDAGVLLVGAMALAAIGGVIQSAVRLTSQT